MIRLLFVVAAGYAAYRLLGHRPPRKPMALLPPPDGRRTAEKERASADVPSEAG
jgi:hypothetical protein